MLKEILKSIEDVLKKNSKIKKTGIYKMEFEEGVDSNPVTPCAFHSFNGFKPTAKTKGGKIAANITQIKIYAADKSISEPIGLDFVESLIDDLDGITIDVKIINGEDEITHKFNVEIADEGMNAYSYKKGMQVFTLDINVFK